MKFVEDRPIGVFDSGVGGLTVLTELNHKFPKEKWIYLGDTLHFPYGTKQEEQIIEYAMENVRFLISQNAKMIIIACGTATSYALKKLQENFSLPIIGIINPTVSYLKKLGLTEVRRDCNRRHC